MTEWSPIQSVIIWTMNKLGLLQNRRLICLSWVWLQTELDNTNSCYQLIKTMTKFETEPDICYTCSWKKKTTTSVTSAKCKTTASAHDAFCLLSYISMVFYFPFNCPINTVQLQAWSIHHPITAQMGQVITNHVPEFCHSFDYKLKRTELHHNEQMKKNIPHLLNENRFM